MSDEPIARDIAVCQVNSNDVMSFNISKKLRDAKNFPYIKGDFSVIEYFSDGSMKISKIIGVAPAPEEAKEEA